MMFLFLNIYTIEAIIWVIIGLLVVFNKVKLTKHLYIVTLICFILTLLSYLENYIPVFC